MIIPMGDFNAKVGNNHTTWGKTLGRHEMEEKENENGHRLLEFCSSNNMCITNTQVIQRKCRKTTWTSPDGNTNNLIDYIITREEWLTSIKKTRAYRSAEIGSDHNLIISEVQLKVHGRRTPTRRRYNTEALKDLETQKKFQRHIRDMYTQMTKNEGKDEMNETLMNKKKNGKN